MFMQVAVKALAGEFRTFQELVFAALDARTFSADGPTNLAVRNQYKSSIRNASVAEVFINPQGDIYMMDAFKGVRNGLTTQASWVAADFTNQPGGGELLSLPKFAPGARSFHLGSRMVYAVADTIIYLDFTVG